MSDVTMHDRDSHGEISTLEYIWYGSIIKRLENNICLVASEKHLPDLTQIRMKKKRRKEVPWTRAVQLSRQFVRNDAISFFLQTWEPTLVAWVSLQRATRLPVDKPISSLNVTASVRRIDSVIAGGGGTDLPRRFGYVQLYKFLEDLRARVRRERALGLIQLENGHVDAAHAHEIYRKAQRVTQRKDVLRRNKQIGSRWMQLASTSTFLLIVFSETAESFAWVDWTTYFEFKLTALQNVSSKGS